MSDRKSRRASTTEVSDCLISLYGWLFPPAASGKELVNNKISLTLNRLGENDCKTSK